MCPGAITQNSSKKVAFFEVNKVPLLTRGLTRDPRVTRCFDPRPAGNENAGKKLPLVLIDKLYLQYF